MVNTGLLNNFFARGVWGLVQLYVGNCTLQSHTTKYSFNLYDTNSFTSEFLLSTAKNHSYALQFSNPLFFCPPEMDYCHGLAKKKSLEISVHTIPTHKGSLHIFHPFAISSKIPSPPCNLLPRNSPGKLLPIVPMTDQGPYNSAHNNCKLGKNLVFDRWKGDVIWHQFDFP